MRSIPYSRQEIAQEDLDAVNSVLTSEFLTQGPEIQRFENAIAALHSCAFGVAVCNATAALHIACMALDLGSGDLLWTSPNSFVASANCARYCGADVDFVDVDPLTRNMSVAILADKLADAQRNGRLPKIVVPVDFAGLPCDLREIRALADKYGFHIISDSSHAVGASYLGEPIGKYSDVTILSFHPVKIITTGEGGVCLTNNADLAEKLKLLRSHGITRDAADMENIVEGPWYYEQVSLGYNYRLTDIQAALGRSQLERLPVQYARREMLARRYDSILSRLPLKLPARLEDRQSAHHLYVVEIDAAHASVSRKSVFEHLRANGIGANVHYIPIHLHPYYQRLGFAKGDFPASENYYAQAITLPLYPALTESQQDYILATLVSAFAP